MAENLTLTDLNADCLLKVFKCCDLETLTSLVEVCRTFRDIIRAEVFPKFRQLEFYYDGSDHVEQKKFVSNIGPYIHELSIRITCDVEESNYIPFFKYVVSWIGPNIRVLNLSSPTLPPDLISILRPIFARLESLKISCTDNIDFDYNVDCCSMCPNLLHLHMQGDSTFIPNAEPWAKLESLALGDNEFTCNQTLERFLANNPQVKRLKVSTFNADLLIEEVVAALPNLEQWVIYGNNSDLLASNAGQLQRLKQLTDLKILRIHSDEFNGIVRALAKCTELRHLKVQSYHEGYEESLFKPDEQNILTVVGELRKLETFDISRCTLSESSVIDFIKFAPDELQELHLHNCEVTLTGPMIRRIAEVISLRKVDEDAKAFKICAELPLEEDLTTVSAL